MKRIGIILLFVFTLSCSSDDSKSSETVNDDSLVSQVVYSYSQGSTATYALAYDENKRDSQWAYTNLQIYREEEEPVYDNGNPIFTYTLNLNPQGLIGEAFTKIIGHAYARYFTYDNRNRVVKEEIHEQYLDPNTGIPNTNPELYETYSLTWDDDDNLVSIKMQFATESYYFLTTFSDFTDFKNTVKPSNFGFDFFGPHGYPVEDLHGGGNGGFYFNKAYAGEYLPAKKQSAYYYTATNEPYPSESYAYNISYQKDNQGRITEIFQEQEGGDWWYKTRYSY